ncbi:MAG: hypothetical protein IT562_07910 [Alphaproteobacteria bacterium]|nr:hypothetical protein [Alphaproteobacteria bacterium]
MIDALLLDCEQTEGGVNVLLRRPDLGGRVDAAPMHDLPRIDLARYRGLLVTLHADQRLLARQRGQLEAFLASGGTIVFCGHVAYPIMDELRDFTPIPGYRIDDLRVNLEQPHPVWSGVDAQHLTFRKGVAGFYGRGCNPPPPGARVINTLGKQRWPVDFECRPSAGGRLLVHAGSDLWAYLEADSSASRMGPQLLDWIAAGPADAQAMAAQ